MGLNELEFMGFCCCLQMWEDLIMKAKEGGLDVIETYVFWNVHEPSQGNVLYSFFVSWFLGFMASFLVQILLFFAMNFNIFFWVLTN